MSPTGLRERVSRRQAIKNGFIARAGVRRVRKKKKIRNTNCNTSVINARPLWFTAERNKKNIRYLFSNVLQNIRLFYVLRTSSI